MTAAALQGTAFAMFNRVIKAELLGELGGIMTPKKSALGSNWLLGQKTNHLTD